MPQSRLGDADRSFFATLADIVYGNAFAPDRMQVIARLVPGRSPEELANDPEALARVVMPRLEPFLRAGGVQASALSEANRRLLEPAFLYVCYQRAVPQLDALIERQAIKSGEPRRSW